MVDMMCLHDQHASAALHAKAQKTKAYATLSSLFHAAVMLLISGLAMFRVNNSLRRLYRLSIIQNLSIVLLHEYYVPANDDERSFSHIFEF